MRDTHGPNSNWILCPDNGNALYHCFKYCAPTTKMRCSKPIEQYWVPIRGIGAYQYQLNIFYYCASVPVHQHCLILRNREPDYQYHPRIVSYRISLCHRTGANWAYSIPVYQYQRVIYCVNWKHQMNTIAYLPISIRHCFISRTRKREAQCTNTNRTLLNIASTGTQKTKAN